MIATMPGVTCLMPGWRPMLMVKMLTCLPLVAVWMAVPAIAQQPGDSGYREITTFYEISTESLESLKPRLEAVLEPRIASLTPDLALEDYIASLDAGDYAPIINSYVAGLSYDRFSELSGGPMQYFYNQFVDSIRDEQFAAIYREYLGEITSDYLMAATSQNFTQYALSRILGLSEEQYSILYQDYIATLWRYYVRSATPEQLIEILGEDYPDTVSGAYLAIEDEKYFYQLQEYLTTLSEQEFIANYRAYVTEMMGGFLIEPPSVINAEGSAAAQVSEQADSEDLAEIAGTTDTEAVEPSPALNPSRFTDLSTEESLRLIRRHIASVARSYFINLFRQDLLSTTSDYTNETALSELSELLLLQDFQDSVQQFLDKINAGIRQELKAYARLTDDEFLGGVRKKLRFVENIAYPNKRLLEIAVSEALKDYRADSANMQLALPSGLYTTLHRSVLDSILLYDSNGVVGIEAPINDSEREAESVVPGQMWEFPGCGCEIDLENVIYGFYPAWEVPGPGDPMQEIDLRFYDRIAYYGLTLDARGDIGNDEHWRFGGAMNDFIQEAHIRQTRVDLAIYAPTWYEWEDPQITIASANIIDKLSIPLDLAWPNYFAANYLVPLYPTSAETIGKDTMGDGVTLYFDSLEDPDTGEVRNLDTIVRLVSFLSNQFAREFGEGRMPINLLLDFQKENTEQIFEQLRPLILGTQANANQYIARILLFLEQDTWDSSQLLTEATRRVFKDADSAVILRKLHPILIPAMDAPGAFPSLTRDLQDLRWNFGEDGGAGIWPIPLDHSGQGGLIEEAFSAAMVDDDSGSWQNWRRGARVIYFERRLSIVFSLTVLYLLSMAILIWSIREPIRGWILLTSKVVGGTSFILFMLSAAFIDPYLDTWRIWFFLLPVLFVVLVVPAQNAPIGAVSSGISENRYVKRSIKRQRMKAMRGLRRSLRQGLFGGQES